MVEQSEEESFGDGAGDREYMEEVHHSLPDPDTEAPPRPSDKSRRRCVLWIAAIVVIGGTIGAFFGGVKSGRGAFGEDGPFGGIVPGYICWGENCEDVCEPARSHPSENFHVGPTEGMVVEKVAYTSCIKPEQQVSDVLWSHMRNIFKPDLFVWLGDNMYSDGISMEMKRRAYNRVRNDQYYLKFGPIAEPKIPVIATWDDHDFSTDDADEIYPCTRLSQNEFALHFGLDPSDPRHPDQGPNQQRGVYSAHMFSKPGGGNGLHHINLDGRSHRTPTYERNGPCKGPESDMLGPEQWAWFEREMMKPSEIKVIGSGVQVLPPTHRGRDVASYCAYDGGGNSFDKAIADVGEGPNFQGTQYESWSEIPVARTRLLRLAQKSINGGYAKRVIFLSGDQHWAEIQAKKVPSDDVYGAEQILYEVTASGIDQNWPYDIPNSNRVRVRSADNQGSGIFDNECNFPFVYNGVKYNNCTPVDRKADWCSTQTDEGNNYIPDKWGFCLPEEQEIVPRSKQAYGRGNKCTDNYHHTCSAQANYGGITVDWEKKTIELALFTPHETETIASSIEIDF